MALSEPRYQIDGVAVGDYDGDGWDDMFFPVIDENGYSQVFRNNGNGTYSMASASLDLQASGSRTPFWLDVDNDGSVDLHAQYYDGIMVEWNGAQFVEYSTIPAIGSNTYNFSSWVDYDRDGDLDLYVTVYGGANLMFVNDGAGAFSSDATVVPGRGQGMDRRPAWGDYDLDGDLDVYLSSVYGDDICYENQGDGTFLDVYSTLFGGSCSSRSPTWADVDNDGDPDLAICDGGSFRLFRNDAGSSFVELSSVVHQVASDRSAHDLCWQDFDNDGFIDVAVAAWPGGTSAVYQGQGDGSFQMMHEITGGVTNIQGLASLDYDRDGDMDLFAGPAESSGLLRNDDFGGDNHWAQLELEGTASNRSALGARVVLTTGTQTQTRVVGAGDGAKNQSSQIVSFGLGSASSITDVAIYWPSGLEQDATSLVSVDTRTSITEPDHLIEAKYYQNNQLISIEDNTLFACPHGDAEELVVTIDFDDSYASGTVAASDVSLSVLGDEFGICGSPYNDEDGTASNGYTVTLRRKHIYGCSSCDGADCDAGHVGTPDIRVDYTGNVIGAIEGLTVRSPDFGGDGIVNLSDVTVISTAMNTLLGDPDFNGCADLNCDGVVNISDLTLWVPHNNQACPSQKSLGLYDRRFADSFVVSPNGSDEGLYQVSFRVADGVDVLGYEIPLGGSSHIQDWSSAERVDGVTCVVSERNGQPLLFVLATGLGEKAGQRIPLVQLGMTTESMRDPGEVLSGARGSVLFDNGDVVMFDGSPESDITTLAATRVHKVYPNPFNPQVTIQYSVAVPSEVLIQVFDVSGRLVRTLVNEYQDVSTSPRTTIWDGQGDEGIRVPSGVYFWRMKTADHQGAGRLMLIK